MGRGWGDELADGLGQAEQQVETQEDISRWTVRQIDTDR